MPDWATSFRVIARSGRKLEFRRNMTSAHRLLSRNNKLGFAKVPPFAVSFRFKPRSLATIVSEFRPKYAAGK
jgi:hypothetical protein